MVDSEDLLEELLYETEVCTLATASSDGDPQAATVRFVADDEYTIYINTATTYRKYDNLVENPRAAIVVTQLTHDLQLEGDVTELKGDQADRARELYIDKYGRSKYLSAPESTYFRVDPDWIRLLVDPDFPPTYEMIRGEGPTGPH